MKRMRLNVRKDSGVAFTATERAALDSVPPMKRLVCGVCEAVTTFHRGVLRDAVVYTCEHLCGSISAAGVVIPPEP